MRDAFNDEYRQMKEARDREIELYQQAQDEYDAQVARVPIRDNFGSDDEYEDALAEWTSITETLLQRVKELDGTL